jgi:hypothetical protein
MTTLFKTGWKGFNAFMGSKLQTGNVVMIGSPSHNFKTGFGLNLIQHFVRHSDVDTTEDVNKKILVVQSELLSTQIPVYLGHSLDMSINADFQHSAPLDEDYCAKLTTEVFTDNGFDLDIVEGSDTALTNVIVVEKYLADLDDSFTPQVVFMDMALLQHGGPDVVHQLSDLLVRMKVIAERFNVLVLISHPTIKGVWAGSKTVLDHNVVDVELHLTMKQVKSGMGLFICKNDYTCTTLEFQETGSILDDA